MAKRYVIIGAGAIGAGLGGLLINAGVPAALVARGAHLDAIRSSGLLVRSPGGTFTVTPPAAAGPDDLRLTTEDVLVLTTKTQHAEAALAQWADAPVFDHDLDAAAASPIGTSGDLLPVLTALNGVASESMALRWFARVFGVCVWMPATYVVPGEVIVRGAPASGVMHMGRFPAELATDADRNLLAEVASDWGKAGFVVPTPADVMPWKYRKLLGNLGNAFNALLGDVPGAGDLTALARQEGTQIIEAAGIALNDVAEENAARTAFSVQPVEGAPARSGSSTWQSLSRGTGSAESDYLNGEIVAIAHRIGRTAPVNGAVARSIRAAAVTGAKPGDITVEQLRSRLDEGQNDRHPVD